MKKVFFTCLFLFYGMLFAQNYYEVPYVGKRSKLTKLTTEEENKFIKENSIKRIYEVPKQGEKDHYGFFTEEENAKCMISRKAQGLILMKMTAQNENAWDKLFMFL